MGRSVDVVMTTYNKAEFLRRTLASYARQTFSDYRILLVNNGCTDHTEEVVQAYASRLPILCSKTTHTERGVARNQALKLCEAESVLFSDDDRIVPAHFVEAHAQAQAEHKGEVVILGWMSAVISLWCKGYQPESAIPVSLRERLEALDEGANETSVRAVFEAEDLERDFDETIDRYGVLDRDFGWKLIKLREVFQDLGDTPGDIDTRDLVCSWYFGSTGNMSVPRRAIEAVGGFEETFVGWGLEDTELSYRLHKAGLPFLFSGKAINYHQIHDRQDDLVQLHKNMDRFVSLYDDVSIRLLPLMWTSHLSVPEIANIIKLAASSKEHARAFGQLASIIREIYLDSGAVAGSVPQPPQPDR